MQIYIIQLQFQNAVMIPVATPAILVQGGLNIAITMVIRGMMVSDPFARKLAINVKTLFGIMFKNLSFRLLHPKCALLNSKYNLYDQLFFVGEHNKFQT